MLGEQDVQHYLEILSMGFIVHFILFLICTFLLMYKLSKCNESLTQRVQSILIANIVSFGIGISIEYFVFGAIYKGVYEVKDFGYHTPLYITSIVLLTIAMILFVNGLHFLYRIILWKETKEENEKESD